MTVRAFDYGPEAMDRYTIIIGKSVFGMSDNPNHPQGFNQYCGELSLFTPVEQWRCKEIALLDLPKAVLVGIIRRMED